MRIANKLKYSCCDLGSRARYLRGSKTNRVFTCFVVGELAPGYELWAVSYCLMSGLLLRRCLIQSPVKSVRASHTKNFYHPTLPFYRYFSTVPRCALALISGD